MRRTLFTDEQHDYRESFRRFLAEEVLPHYPEWEREGIVPRELYAKAASMGFASMACPSATAAPGIEDFRFNVVVAEEVALAQVVGFGLGLTLHNDVCLPYLLSYATEEQRERWLPGGRQRRADPRDRDDRARHRLRPRRDQHDGDSRRRPISSTARRRSSPTGSTPTW